MAYFLLTYDRSAGTLLSQTTFDEHATALAERFRLEQALAAQPQVEVVVLAAASLEELHRTHARYFSSLRELADDVIATRRAAQVTSPT